MQKKDKSGDKIKKKNWYSQLQKIKYVMCDMTDAKLK